MGKITEEKVKIVVKKHQLTTVVHVLEEHRRSDGTSEVDPEVEYWKEKIRKLSEGGQ